jgi:hypothetical protein
LGFTVLITAGVCFAVTVFAAAGLGAGV